jgi:hypothetical protein
MADTEGKALKTALLAEYGHFADKRIKNIDKGSVFVVDDREQGGLASDGKPFGWFCEVYANLVSDDCVEVTLRGQIPRGRSLDAWMESHGGELVEQWGVDRMVLTVEVGTPQKLIELADAFASIVKPPARYKVPSYKYSCARLYAGLHRLHGVLGRFDKR